MKFFSLGIISIASLTSLSAVAGGIDIVKDRPSHERYLAISSAIASSLQQKCESQSEERDRNASAACLHFLKDDFDGTFTYESEKIMDVMTAVEVVNGSEVSIEYPLTEAPNERFSQLYCGSYSESKKNVEKELQVSQSSPVEMPKLNFKYEWGDFSRNEHSPVGRVRSLQDQYDKDPNLELRSPRSPKSPIKPANPIPITNLKSKGNRFRSNTK